MILIERDRFMKTTNFTLYNKCLENITQFELDQLSHIPACEDVFVRFFKYIQILDESDPKKAEGQKLISAVQQIEKYKILQGGQSILFD